ncbi:hypothetical protein ASZ90_006718 [hydrocarbon metagenome]|uniref:Uncharacterized protein n=1 Tax=hydrocarbon metagenome TaxID=938273 RepID=A0A0W8FRG8_9ZZZZ
MKEGITYFIKISCEESINDDNTNMIVRQLLILNSREYLYVKGKVFLTGTACFDDK